MQVLFKKMKRANKGPLITHILLTLIYIVFFCLFTMVIFKLEGIETFIRIILVVLFSIWFLVYLLFGLSMVITKKYKKFVALTIIEIIFIVIMGGSSFVINKLFSKLDMMTSSEYTLYTTNLIALSDKELSSDSKLGMISNNEDIEGYVLANTLIKNEKLTQEIEYYDDYYTMLNALYNNEVDAVFVSSNYAIIFSSEEIYKNIAIETKVLHEYSEQMKTKSITNSNKKLTEPFTVLLMGVDSEKDGLNANAAFNGDTLMLITFNPETLNATMLSIPRDTYVPIACNNNRYHKINSSAAYGTECVINTVKKLVDVDIDYYAKINFNGVIDLVNALGGLDVDVEKPTVGSFLKKYNGQLCESNSLRDMAKLVCMDTGKQHLNGEQALAYARNRYGFLEGDLARNRHQQQIVEAMAKKLLNVSSFSEFEHLLDVVGKNISTNLTTTQMLSFYQTLKNMLIRSLSGNDFITIQKMYLEVYNLPVVVGGMQLSALGYYEKSLDTIREALNVNLGLKDESMIKTFSYDYNEEYSSPIIGKGVTGGKSEATVPNLIGSTVSKAEEWARSNGVTLITEFKCSDGIPGLIGDQNVLIGTSVRSISSITIYVNQVCTGNNGNDNDNNNNNSNNNNDGDDDNEFDIPGKPTTPDKPNTGNDDKNDDKDNDNKDDNNNSGDSGDIPTIPGTPTEDN